jgi:CheY-like chemotaxis protein
MVMAIDFVAAVTIATALEHGANKFLTKPVDFPQLKQDVAAVIAEAHGAL